MIFYKNECLKNDLTFNRKILEFIDNFYDFFKFNSEEGLDYMYKEGFCKVAPAIYQNDFDSAKNIFTEQTNILKEESIVLKNDSFIKAPIKRLIIDINERRC